MLHAQDSISYPELMLFYLCFQPVQPKGSNDNVCMMQ